MSELLVGERGLDLCTIERGGMTIRALANGCVYSMQCGGILINQILASPLAGGIQRVYLRVHSAAPEGIRSCEIVGPGALSKFSWEKNQFVWSGEGLGLVYRCVCWVHPSGEMWFFRVEVENRNSNAVRCDAVIVQDVGLATRGQVRNNELFTSQYLDHHIEREAGCGPVAISRQNLAQIDGKHPWLMQGCLPGAQGVMTGGEEFFGVGYKAGAQPIGLGNRILAIE